MTGVADLPSLCAQQVPEDLVPLSVTIAPELPSYASGAGLFNGTTANVFHFDNDFLPLVKNYAAGEPIHGAISGCSGECTATVRAPALAVDYCTTEIQYVDFQEPLTAEEAKMYNESGMAPADHYFFSITFALHEGTPERLGISTRIVHSADATKCAANVNITNCLVVSAIGEYPVHIHNGIIGFPEPPSYPRIVARANNTAVTSDTIANEGLIEPKTGAIRTTLGGIAEVAKYSFWIVAAAVRVPGLHIMEESIAAGGGTLFQLQHSIRVGSGVVGTADCLPEYADPRDDIMAVLNEIMFRSGAHYAQIWPEAQLEARLDEGWHVTNNVTGTPLTAINIFQSDFRFYGQYFPYDHTQGRSHMTCCTAHRWRTKC